MHLITKNELIVNDGVSGTKTAQIIGGIVNFSRNGNCTNFGANFQYQEVTPEGEDNKLLEQSSFVVNDPAELQALYDLVKADLPDPNDSEPIYEATKNYLVFRLKMVETFKPTNPTLKVADILLIED